MYGDIALQAQIFVLVLAREGSFHRAAKQLHITQPALTRKINAVEKQLGVKLFVRAYHRLDLTPAGKLFLPEAQASVLHAERAWELARRQAQVESGPLRVGYAPHVHGDLVPLIERWQFEDGSPRGLVVETSSTPELVERVLRGRLHAAFGILPVVDEQLWVSPVTREPFCLSIPKNHRLAQKVAVSARELDRETVFWVARDEHPGFYDQTVEYLEGLGIEPVFEEVASERYAVDIVSHGFGVALLARSMSRFLRTGVVFKTLSDLFMKIETAVFVRRDQRHGPLEDHLQAMLSQIRSLPSNVQ